MIFRLLMCVVSGAMVFASAGCVSKPRFYAVDRPRVDQATMGNAGYIGGGKKDSDTIAGRSTRRIYVFEFDKKKKPEAAPAAKPDDAAAATPVATASAQESPKPSQQGITVPYIGDDEPAAETATAETSAAGMQYTVLKDDTLQKISKKVYGSYNKWTKIYDANKDKIKNPNFVKPGIVITIPPVD